MVSFPRSVTYRERDTTSPTENLADFSGIRNTSVAVMVYKNNHGTKQRHIYMAETVVFSAVATEKLELLTGGDLCSAIAGDKSASTTSTHTEEEHQDLAELEVFQWMEWKPAKKKK